MESAQSSERRIVPELRPLAPAYQAEKHAVYFDAIEKALGWTGEKVVRNIALTGSYGVGKSSILRQVATDPARNVIQVSLSTLGFGSDGPEKKTAEKPGEDDVDNINPLRETKTNQIQKEIVKQLLYTQVPDKMPGSRYRRTSAFNPKREALFSVVAGVPLALAFFLFGWTSKLSSLFIIPPEWGIAANGGMVSVSAAFIFAARYATHNKLRIDSVSTGAATITLSAASDTYFDEYLDEIVYFFEVVNADIVIFEDIDRFEDPHIFETLRELNTILNTAKQLDGRVIRFLYAIKDSIFEELGTRAARELAGRPGSSENATTDAATLEIARANRTKFFDLVIPVVPFITHQSARELMSDELADLTHSVSDGLIDLVAQHVADMRLIKNIRNEFVIFQEQVIRQSSLKLNDDQLFAMVLYKSTHLSDFECIKVGTSNLDILYRESRQMVEDHMSRLNAEMAILRRRLRNISNQSTRSARVGEAVVRYVDRVLGHVEFTVNKMRYDGSVVSLHDIKSTAFWNKYADGNAELEFIYTNPHRGAQVSTLSREELEQVTGESLDPSTWEASARAEIESGIAAARKDIAFLSKADVVSLIARPDFKLESGAGVVSLAERAKSLLGSKLAVELVAQGYIDRYFTLYTSTFVGSRVNANAMNFILKNVDAGAMDFYASLTPEEVKAVVKERPRLALRERSAYNFDFIDYLLKHDEKDAEIVLANLRRNGDAEKKFMQAYLSSERDPTPLVQGLALDWPEVLVFLASDLELDDDSRMKAVDAALAGLADSVDYAVSDEVVGYLRDNHAALTTFTESQPPAIAARVASFVHVADFLVPNLALLDVSVRRAISGVGRFEVTRENMLIAIDPSTDLSLNSLRGASEPVYRRAISDLDSYIALLNEDEPTITDPAIFVSILEDIDEVDRGSLGAIVGGSVVECNVPRLSAIAPGTWPSLASHSRFPAEFRNVAIYVEQYGIDENLAVVLASKVITFAEDVEEDEKVELALEVIASADHLPSAELRVSLIESLSLETYLPASAVPPETGDLVGRLIENNVIEDGAESFALIPGADWMGLEYAICASSSIGTFITPEILPVAVLPQFLASGKVSEALKRSVAERFSEFSVGAGRAALEALASYALTSGVRISWEDLMRVARADVDLGLTLSLTQGLLDDVDLDGLLPLLEVLGGDYPAVGAPNGKRRRFANTEANRALMERLKELGTVSRVVPDGTDLKVNMKRG